MTGPTGELPFGCAYEQCDRPAAPGSVLCAEHAAAFSGRPSAPPTRRAGLDRGQWATAAGIAVVIVGVIAVLIFGSAHDNGQAPVAHAPVTHRHAPAAYQPPLDVPSSVIYLLTGTASAADITYSTGGGTEQQTDVAVPLRDRTTTVPGMQFEVEPGGFLYFSAQNRGGGSLTCQIMVDGSVVDQHTSYGRYAVVSCQGTA